MKQSFIVDIAVPGRDATAKTLVCVAEDRHGRAAPGQSGEDRYLEHPGRFLGTTPAVQVGDDLVIAMSTRGAGA